MMYFSALQRLSFSLSGVVQSMHTYRPLVHVSIVAFLFSITSSSIVFAQHGSTVLARIKDEAITYNDIEKAFRKNLNNPTLSLRTVPKDSVRTFLELYINYRLKIHEARRLGIDTTAEVRNDIATNRATLAPTFYFDKVITERFFPRFVERRGREVVLQFLQFSQNFQKDTSNRAYRRALNAITAIKGGIDMAVIARDSSDDKRYKETGGILPAGTAGSLRAEIEDIAFRLKEGEISDPIRTPIGYFVVKVLSNQPKVNIWGGHILISFDVVGDTVSALKKADSVYALLKAGASFTTMAKAVSDDPSSKTEGGMFGAYYSRSQGLENNSGGGKFLDEFEKAWFALKDGEFSTPVRTIYGYHIIYRQRSITGNTADMATLKRDYKATSFQNEREALYDSLRIAKNYTTSQAVLQEIYAAMDTTKNTGDSWAKNFSPSLRAKELISNIKPPLTVQRFVDTLAARNDARGLVMRPILVERLLNRTLSDYITAEQLAPLEKNFPEFADLMQEYRDGVSLFKLEDQVIWSKLKFDSVKAKKYWQTIKEQFTTGMRLAVTEIFLRHDSSAHALHRQLTTASVSVFDKRAAQLTEREGFKKLKGKHKDLVLADTDIGRAILSEVKDEKQLKAGMILKPLAADGGYAIIRVDKIMPERMRTFEEAIPYFASKYQDQLQRDMTNAWLVSLRHTYPISIETSVFDTIWK